MAISLRSLTDDQDLDLQVIVEGDLDAEITWAHATELDDPKPYLNGGELILTLGRSRELTPKACRTYVRRLVAARVAGLAFGVGLGHRKVPAALADACMASGLTLLAVPKPTPFIAIVRTVAEAIAAEQREEELWLLNSQRALSRAASLGGGIPAVIDQLAKATGRWVVHCGMDGAPLHSAGSRIGGNELIADFDADIRRLLAGPPRGTASVTAPDRTVVMHALGAGRQVQGVLLLGGNTSVTSSVNTLLASAVALTAISLRQDTELTAARASLRSALLAQLLNGQLESVRQTVRALGTPLPRSPVTALLVRGSAAQLEAVEEALAQRAEATLLHIRQDRLIQSAEQKPAQKGIELAGSGFFHALANSELVIVCRANEAAELADFSARTAEVSLGVSARHNWADIGQAVSEARTAVDASGGTGIRWFGDLTADGMQVLTRLPGLRLLAEERLAPVIGYDAQHNTDLLTTLGCWLNHSGAWDGAATELGVHRHTVRYRIRQIAELLDASFDDPDARFELWWAYRVLKAQDDVGHKLA
ncbi:PucR family transcriptional regulator [Saxibacter everestensis]|uniref:PucR family transcriptional regulator n=1 Tax=Saxibacter everestensis TaxID=2909229 RepID=A0ABY8QU30_9MICO|nr:PucR family transcriptional regulator [Brevibacteriaceae bacterium ZFBP1038]